MFRVGRRGAASCNSKIQERVPGRLSIGGGRMDTALLIIHAICALFLIGAITHQALGVFWPRRPGQSDFVAKARGINPGGYVTAIMVLYVVPFLLGAYICPVYRVYVRPPLQDL